jgi:glycosyltransferase involved in cell wall biosynthesis
MEKVRIAVFINQLGIGGSEKAACRWTYGLVDRGHDVEMLTLNDGPRRAELEARGIRVHICACERMSILQQLHEFRPDVIHLHAPGHPHQGDVLGEALKAAPKKIPVVQTNIFGQLENPKEDVWTDFRLFISWTSCVQAARRYFQRLDKDFFQNASVAVYPLDPDDGPGAAEAENFRQRHGIKPDEILFGRLSRPEPNKWTDLTVDAFRSAAAQNSSIKLLLREPPPAVAESIARAPDHERFAILPATYDKVELARTTASLDVVLHTSSVGESFGYGIAEPMNYGKPVIANSTPWRDQAQIELVRHGECGFVASTAHAIGDAILKLACDPDLRKELGRNAQAHIRALADPMKSIEGLEMALRTAVSGRDNPRASEDLMKAKEAADYLERHQFGHTWREQLALRPTYYRTRFHEWRKPQKLALRRILN